MISNKLSPEEKDEAAARLKELAEKERELQEMTSKSFTHIMSDYEAITNLYKNLNINATEARKQLQTFPSEYTVDGQTIPDLIKKMRKARRQLKGEHRIKMAKAIDTVIDGYSDHISKCIKSIYWITPYEVPLLKMRFNEKDLQKLNKIDDVPTRRQVVDSLCKMWEATLKQDGMAFSSDFAKLEKDIRSARKDFREVIKSITDQSITKSKKERTYDFIFDTICENPGIGVGQIYDRMPTTLHKNTSTKIIKGMIKWMVVITNYRICSRKTFGPILQHLLIRTDILQWIEAITQE